jgi:hypothetical protein
MNKKNKKNKAVRLKSIQKLERVVSFSPNSERLSSDYDVLLGYQIFLGRNPENSFVIQYKKSQPIQEMVRGFLASQEFWDLVARPLAEGAGLIHSAFGTVMAPEHISWIEDLVNLPEDQRATLARAVSWSELFGVLSALECFPTKKIGPEIPRVSQPSIATAAPGDARFTELIDGMRRIETLLRAALSGQILPVRADTPVQQLGDGKRTGEAVPDVSGMESNKSN